MPLSLHLSLDKNKVPVGDLPEATLRLLNEGTEMVIVNARMLLAARHTPATLKEVTFFIKGPKESINLKMIHVNSGLPVKENFVRLFPGEYIFQTYSLPDYYSYETKGEYKIVAEYNNETKIEIDNVKSWIGKVKSNEENFEVI